MKIKMYVVIIAAFFVANVSKGQSSPSKLLIGKWNVESLSPAFPAGATDKQKAKGEKVIAEDTKAFKATGFTFSTDGKLSVNKKEFSWKMDANGKTVTVSKGKKVVSVGTISELTEHKLVFSRPDEGMIVTCVLTR